MPEEQEIQPNLKCCIKCMGDIHADAVKCQHCGSFQDWRRHLNAFNTFLALLIAFITISVSLAPYIKKLFESKAPDLEFSFLKWDMDEGPVFTVVNPSSYNGYVEHLVFEITVDSLTLHGVMYVDDQGNDFLDIPAKSMMTIDFKDFYSLSFSSPNSTPSHLTINGISLRVQPEVLKSFEALISQRFENINTMRDLEKISDRWYKIDDITFGIAITYRSFIGIHTENDIIDYDSELSRIEFFQNMSNKLIYAVKGFVREQGL